ncbi:APC family permease [Metaclostridioides mangenotii]|uniref:APC family permease n=1 Tax=Metaclostridioides mangenotii TaxID=1540 RepID=UPI000486ACF7|nr:amino acid permease [Clostridioides mangenotii]
MGEQLKKTLGLPIALSIVVGMVIGSGVFFKPQAVYELTGGAPGLGIIAWILGGLITIAAGLTAAEISTAIPKTGGMMVYLEEIYGEKLGFLAGWAQTVLYFPGASAALGVVFSQQVIEFIGKDPNNMLYTLPIAVGVIVFIAMLNNIGSEFGGKIQTVSTICKLVPLFIIIIFGFSKGQSTEIFTPMVGEGKTVSGVLGNVLLAILFAYDGWINVGSIAGEMKNPGKDLPKAIIGGLSIVMSVYIIINIAYLWVLPASELAQAVSPGALVATKIFGPIGGKIVSIGIMISVFGTLNGFILTGPRVPYALAVKGFLPGSKYLSKVNKGGSPYFATWLIAIIACIYATSGQFNLLTDLSIFAVWIFYVFTFIGVIKLRKDRPDMERPYKVPLYPIIPIIAIASGLFVIINQLITATVLAAGCIFLTLLGLPIYTSMKKKL